jgi:hypothetical protein
MPTITFRAKVENIVYPDGTPAQSRVKVPTLTNRHCDMHAFRTDKKFGPYANSDLFPSVLARAVKALGVRDYIRLDQIPDAVTVDASGFLARVTIDL